VELDLLAYLEDLDARRRTLTNAERERYRACLVAICAGSPAARAAYHAWSEQLSDLRTSAAVVIAAVKAEDAAAAKEPG
jgi:hypothetical protein